MSETEEDNLFHQYTEYLERFDEKADRPTELGTFGKCDGRLLKKMRYDEFADKLTKYHRATQTYFKNLNNGGTINDAAAKTIRSHAIELIIDSPV